MSILRRAVLLAVSICAFAVLASAADITGKWKAEFDTQIGVQKYTFDLKVDGDKLTGKASFERMEQKGEVDLVECKINGSEISFVEKVDFQGNELRIEYKGKVNADEIKFTRRVGDFATEEFVAKRVKN
ncbi:MAG TPA: hypothetical protein VFV34_11210 [Blastocatellia bacterium]|nr:hypothetical protein [Blastocatellia bacterium]